MGRRAPLPAAQQGTDALLIETTFSTTGFCGEVHVTAKLMRQYELLTQNRLPFYALDLETWAKPMPPIAAIDPHRLLNAPALGPETPRERPIVVACEDAPDETTLAQFAQLFDRVRDGAVAVLLKPPIQRSPGLVQRLNGFWKAGAVPPDESRLLASDLFPLELHSRLATGMWVPVNHIVKAHPIFEGLPANQMMDHVYQNVCPAETLDHVEGETVVGALSFEWRDAPRNYLGCREFWWGSSLVIVPLGKGKLVLSTLRLLENLGQDPVADMILRNLVRFAEL